MNERRKRVGDCAAILPGHSLKARARHEPEGVYQVIMASHLSEAEAYRYQPRHALRMTPGRNMDKYRVHAGDILFIARGTHNHAVVVESVPDHTIASGNLYILRTRDDVVPQYLAWCVNQAPTQAEIAQARTGAGTPIVQRSAFADIVIPLPPLARQEKIARLGDLMTKERALRKQLLEQTEALHKLMGTRLLKQLQPE